MGMFDWLIGGKANPTLLPGVQDSINSLNGMNFGLGKQGKIAKHFLSDWSAGKDTSDSGFYEPIRQSLQSDLSDIDMEGATGAAQLASQFGGSEQTNLQNQLIARQKERRREAAGRDTSNAMTGLAGWASNTLEQANARRDSDELARQQLLLGARGMTYDRNRRSGGILGNLIAGGAQVGGAYLGRDTGG